MQTREFTIIMMWAGQLAGEALNWFLKRAIKQDRPVGMFIIKAILNLGLTWNLESIGNGYGFPSSHSQYMAYFSSFLICHLYFRHRFASTGFPIIDRLFRATVYLALLLWTGAVAYSRYKSKKNYNIFKVHPKSLGSILDIIT